jgi:hypothetical protein
MNEGLNYTPPEAQKSEMELRKERFLVSLENLKNIDLADIYPPEIEKRDWVRITNAEEVEEFLKEHFGNAREALSQDVYLLAIFKDTETGTLLAAPSFMKKEGPVDIVAQPLLDLLFAAKKMAPWSRFASVGLDRDEQYFTAKQTGWTMRGHHLVINVGEMELLIRDLGDLERPEEYRHDLLRTELATVIHESVHVSNEQDGDYEHGPIIGEIAPTTEEYLIFPGRNNHMEGLAQSATKLISGDIAHKHVYSEALALGFLLLTDRDGLLSDEDSAEALLAGVDSWKKHIFALDDIGLDGYRKEVEEEIFLAQEDVKLRQVLGPLIRRYPKTLGHLTVINRSS